jgi:hypothetical protein
MLSIVSAFAVARVLLAPATVAVIEARTDSGANSISLTAAIASRVSAMSPEELSKRVADQLPESHGSDAEPVLEAEELLERGKDAYIEGHFDRATADLGRAEEILKRAVNALEEERKTSEALFRAHMYLAFTLQSRGGSYMAQARETLREAIRTFPLLEPSHAEYGPEKVRFFRDVKAEMDKGPLGELRIQTSTGENASVYLNGRLVGVTPLDLKNIYPGRYWLHLRTGHSHGRVRQIEIAAGTNEVQINPSLDRSLAVARDLAALQYNSAGDLHHRIRGDVRELARLLHLHAVIVFYADGDRLELYAIDDTGKWRRTVTDVSHAPEAADQLRTGRVGDVEESAEAEAHHTWSFVIGGVAVAAVLGGVIVGLSAQSDFDTLNTRYPNHVITNPADASLRDGIGDKALTANILFGVAAASAVGAVFMFIHERHVQPVLAPNYAGAMLTVQF